MKNYKEFEKMDMNYFNDIVNDIAKKMMKKSYSWNGTKIDFLREVVKFSFCVGYDEAIENSKLFL